MPVLPHSRKNDALAANPDALQVMEFSTRHNVKTAAPPGKVIQNGKISVGLYGKTQSVGQRTKTLVEFFVGIIDGSTAVQVGWSSNFFRNRTQRHTFADHFFAG